VIFATPICICYERLEEEITLSWRRYVYNDQNARDTNWTLVRPNDANLGNPSTIAGTFVSTFSLRRASSK